MSKSDIKPGDPVKVRKVVMEGIQWRIKYIPATVIYAKPGSIGVQYADGKREAVEDQDWRFPDWHRP